MPKKAVIFLAFANDRVEGAQYLRNLPKELDGVRKALYLAEKMGLCEVVERANVTIDHIVSVFQDERYRDRIAVFHYGGHADGYELLLESLDGSPVASQAGGLVPFFARQKGLKLVFLNGCANRPQALEMNAAGIPFVIGTNQVINDAIATRLAIRFYKGLAEGLTLDRAWAQAEDEINMSQRAGSIFRSIKFKAKDGNDIHDHPWEIHIADGAESVKNWSLPKASGDLLFGLPDLPKDIVPPQQPFLFFKRYERKDAYVFFGRSFYVRELYNRITNFEGPPLILLYGQSGVGKSSLLEAGILPYLEHDYAVEIVRRRPEWGLSGSLEKLLDKVEKKLGDQEEISIGAAASDEANTELASPIQQLMLQMEESLKALEEKEAPESRILREKLQAMKAHSEEILEGIQRKEEEKKTSRQIRLQKLEKVKDKSGFLFQWLSLEARLDRPLILILDQVEEVFTRPGENPKELSEFFEEVREIFQQPDLRPDGKLLLSYRKEYHAEIEESCKSLSISRSYVFVERLKKADIMEVITGLKAPRFRDHYSFEIEEEVEGELANKIADELLSDSNSSVAPILQILVTKMWDQSEDENNHHCFSDELYEELKDKGILLDKFFEQQVEEVRKELGPIVESGLLLDLLHRHTTRLGTADSKSLESLREFYNHRSDDLEKLIAACKDRYLLSEAGSQLYLVHDTLAPLVQKAFRESDLPGQRAYRILDNKIADFEQDKGITLDQLDLSLVEKGEAGMRIWEPAERELVHLSRIRRENEQKAQKRRWMAFGLLMAAIAILGIVSLFQKENIRKQNEMILGQKDRLISQNLTIGAQNDSILGQNQKISQQKDSIKSKEDEAIAQREEAYRQRNIARSENFVNQTSLLLRDRRPEALNTAIASWKTNPGFSSYGALLRAYHFSPVQEKIGSFEDRGRALEASPDGKFYAAASGGRNAKLFLYDDQFRKIGTFQDHSRGIKDLALSKDLVVSIGEDNAMLIRSTSGESIIRKKLGKKADQVLINTPLEKIYTLIDTNVFAFSLDGKEEGKILSFKNSPSKLALSRDGQFILAGYDDGKIQEHRLSDPGEIKEYSKNTSQIISLQFSESGSRFLSSSQEGDLLLWDRMGSSHIKLGKDNKRVLDACFFGQDRYVASASVDSVIKIWDAKSGMLLLNLIGHTDVVSNIAASKDGQFILSTSEDKSVRKWNLAGRHQKIWSQRNEEITSFAFSGKAREIISGNSSGNIRIEDGGIMRSATFPNASSSVIGIEPSSDKKYVAIVRKKGAPFIWNPITQKVIKLEADMKSTSSLDVGRGLIAAGDKNAAYLWDKQGRLIGRFPKSKKIYTKLVTISPDEKLLISLDNNKNAYIWDIREQSLKGQIKLTAVRGQASCILYDPSAERFYLSSDDDPTAIYAFSVREKKLISEFFPHPYGVTSMAISPNRKFLLTGDVNGSFRLWDWEKKTEEAIFTHKAHTASITKVAFSPDGTYVSTSSDDGSLRMWLISPQKILASTPTN